MIDDKPQFAVICRKVGTPLINIYSRHPTRLEAEGGMDHAAWKHNRKEITYHLAVVDL